LEYYLGIKFLVKIAERLVRSYEMMLGFYGMIVADRKTGRLARASNYEER